MILTDQERDALLRDMEKCELGLMLTRGKIKKQYADHLKVCKAAFMAHLKALPVDPDIEALSDAELLAELIQ